MFHIIIIQQILILSSLLLTIAHYDKHRYNADMKEALDRLDHVNWKFNEAVKEYQAVGWEYGLTEDVDYWQKELLIANMHVHIERLAILR